MILDYEQSKELKKIDSKLSMLTRGSMQKESISKLSEAIEKFKEFKRHER